jgi:hypothetical protein
MKKIIIYTLLATIFSSCITEKKITEKKQIKEWDINYTENNLDSELPVSKSKNEILNDSYYQSKKILPVVEQLLASNEELKNDIIINQHLELEKHKNIKNIIIRNDSIKKKNSLSDNNLKNKVSDIAKLSKISIRSFLLFFTSMSIYGIADLAGTDGFGIIGFTMWLIGVLGLLGAAVGLLFSFWAFIKIKYNKINVAEQDKKVKRNFRISNFISWFIIGITTFLIVWISSWSFG